MMGSGIFINSAILAQKAGALGAACYLAVGFLMLPLILSVSSLLRIYPSGGFYTFASKELHPFIGFAASWCYATGKLASVILMNQLAIVLMQQIIPALNILHSTTWNGIIILLFLALNMLDMKTGSTIQTWFFVLKILPILFAILAGLYLFSPGNVSLHDLPWSGVPIALPFVLFALAGFEAACSLSSRIENAEKNAPLVVLFSYGFVVLVTTLFQFSIYSGLGSLLSSLPDYRFLFPALFSSIFAMPLSDHLTNLVHLAVACSALGGSYGILFSNNWNFYTLAQHHHLVGSKSLTRFNRFQIPWLCVLLEGLICFIFLATAGTNQVPLQQISAFGAAIAYAISCVSLVFAIRNKHSTSSMLLPALGIGSCSILISATIYSFITLGTGSLFVYGGLFAVGVSMYLFTLPNFNSDQRKQA